MRETLQTVALVDPWAGGHHTSSMCNFAHAILAMGLRPLVLCPEPERVRDCVASLCPERASTLVAEHFDWKECASPSWRLRQTVLPLKRFHHVARAIRAARRLHRGLSRPRAVLFCWMDDYLQEASMLLPLLLPVVFRYTWSGIFFHPRFLRIRSSDYANLRNAALRILRVPNIRSIAVLDEGVAAALRDVCKKPVVTFPEYMDTRLPEHESALGSSVKQKAHGRPIIGLVGSLEKRKGVLRILDLAESTECPDVLFALVGSLGADERTTYSVSEWNRLQAMLSNPPANVFLHTIRIADERDFNAAINAMDVIYAAYENFPHSSGVLTKAAAYEKPVLVSRGYCMEERVNRFRTGIAVDPKSLDEVVQAIECEVNRNRFLAEIGKPDFRGYVQAHSWGAMLDAFESMLRPCGVVGRPS